MTASFPLTVLGILACLAVLAPRAWPQDKLVLGAAPPAVGQPFPLSMEQAIDIGLKNNVSLLNAQARRALETFDLRLAERRFTPVFSLDSDVSTTRNTSGGTTSELSTASLGPRVTALLPTGASVSATIGGQLRDGTSVTGTRQWSARVDVDQPLLRGGGIRFNKLPVAIARKEDEAARQVLRSVYNQLAVSIAQAYYDAILAERQVAIASSAYDSAIRLVENNEALIRSGRLARSELEQAKADVAVQNRALLDAQRQHDDSLRALLLLLSLPPESQARLTTGLMAPDYVIPDVQETIAVTRASNPDLIIARLDMDIARHTLALSEDVARPDLSLFGSYSFNGISGFNDLPAEFFPQQSQSDWRVGLRLSVPLNDLNRKRERLSARTNESIARNELNFLEELTRSEVQRVIANLRSLQYQLEISRRGVAFSERAIAAEIEKFQAGRSSNFQVLLLENSLNAARQNEVRDVVEFLKAVVQIELLKGTILDGWGIEFHG